MRGWTRILGLFAGIALAAPAPALAAHPASTAQDERQEDYAAEIARFLEQLGRVRAGDDGALTTLRTSADRLCSVYGRCDAAEVAGFYAGLTAEDRIRGLADEQRFVALRERVIEAGRGQAVAEDWPAERERVLTDLNALRAEVRGRRDFLPAAQAASLCARIQVQRLEDDPGLSPADQASLAEAAEADALEASRLFERAGQVTPRLEPRWILGRLQHWRGELGAARASFESCLSDARRVGNDDFREHGLVGLAGLARELGDVPEERRLLARWASFRDPATSWPLARDWAATLLLDDHAAEAARFLAEREPGPDDHVVDHVEWNLLIGSSLVREGRLEAARPHFERLAEGPGSELARLALARLALQEGRAYEALEQLDEEDARGFTPRSAFEAAALRGEALLAVGDDEPAVAELSRALEQAERWDDELAREPLGSGRTVAESAAASVIGERLGLHTVALLAEAHTRLDDPLEAVRVIENAQSRSLRRQAEALRDLRREAGQTGAPVIEGDDVVTWARRFELGLVTWVVGADFSVVGFVGPEADGRLVAWTAHLEYGRADFREAARRLREAAIADDTEHLARASAEVRDALFPTWLLERLRAAAARTGPVGRLLLLLHGPLEGLPIELIGLDPQHPTSLDDTLTAVVLPGLPEAQPGAKLGPEELATWRLLGSPVDGGGRRLLPGAASELEDLRGLRPGASVVAGAAFDRAALDAALRSGGPLHVSTHLVAPCACELRRLDSVGLQASEGPPYCAHRVAELGPRLPLVVLAACATGAGSELDAEGLQGLARAFLEAGTRNLLVTSWPVADGAARHASLSFHRALQTGLSPSRAARRARLDLSAAGFGPSEWAAFRLLGRD